MCTNEVCPLSYSCWRFNCPPSQYQQSYAKFEPQIDEVLDEVECKMYLKIYTMIRKGKKFDKVKFALWVAENTYYQSEASFKEHFYFKGDVVRQTFEERAKKYTIYQLHDIFVKLETSDSNGI